jgi:hypothetical protein
MSADILRRRIANASQRPEPRKHIDHARCVRCSAGLSRSIVTASSKTVPSAEPCRLEQAPRRSGNCESAAVPLW